LISIWLSSEAESRSQISFHSCLDLKWGKSISTQLAHLQLANKRITMPRFEIKQLPADAQINLLEPAGTTDSRLTNVTVVAAVAPLQ